MYFGLKQLERTVYFSSPEPKAHGELIVWYSSRRPSVRLHFQRSSPKPLGQLKKASIERGVQCVY